jgi:hypothetical protein
MAPLALVVKKDATKGTLYASRNMNDYVETLSKPNFDRAEIDWQVQLRLKPDDVFATAHVPNEPPPERLSIPVSICWIYGNDPGLKPKHKSLMMSFKSDA